jgi:DNA polymerase elongation subunit (family B)
MFVTKKSQMSLQNLQQDLVDATEDQHGHFMWSLRPPVTEETLQKEKILFNIQHIYLVNQKSLTTNLTRDSLRNNDLYENFAGKNNETDSVLEMKNLRKFMQAGDSPLTTVPQDHIEDPCYVYLMGITEEGHAISVEIEDFMPFYTICFNENLNFSQYAAMDLHAEIMRKLKLKNEDSIRIEVVHASKGYGFHIDESTHKRQKYSLVKVYAKNIQLLRKVWHSCIKTYEEWDPELYVSKASQTTNFMDMASLTCCAWASISREHVEYVPFTRRHTNNQLEYICHNMNEFVHEDIQEIPSLIECCFDIECTSRSFAFPISERDPILSIGLSISKNGDIVKRIMLYNGQVMNTNEEIEVICFEEELLLLECFHDLVTVVYDVDFLIAYNGIEFDTKYIIDRYMLLKGRTESRFPYWSRFISERSEWFSIKVESKAYGTRFHKYFNAVGRVNFDLFDYVNRNMKLTSYSLDNVAKTCLDIDTGKLRLFYPHFIQEMFDLCIPMICEDMSPLLNSEKSRTELNNQIQLVQMYGQIAECVETIIASKNEDHISLINELDQISYLSIYSEYEITLDTEILTSLQNETFEHVNTYELAEFFDFSNIFILFVRSHVQNDEHQKIFENMLLKRHPLDILRKTIENIIKENNLAENNLAENLAIKCKPLHAALGKGIDHTDNYAKMFALHGWGSERHQSAIVNYCSIDCDLPLQIMKKMTIVSQLVKMSEVCHTNLQHIVVRGQQIKVFNQLKRQMHNDNIGMNTRDLEWPDDEAYEGATVIDPIPGMYMLPVATLDFAALYPSEIISHNLCFSSLILDAEELQKCEQIGIRYECITIVGRTWYFVQGDIKRNGPHENYVEDQTQFLGILPKMLINLLHERGLKKKLMKAAAKANNKLLEALYNAWQLSIKVSANSGYGFMGVKPSMALYGCMPVAAATTYWGRCDIDRTQEFMLNRKYGTIYGDTDSVMLAMTNKNVPESFETGIVLGKDATEALFRPPMDLEFEKVYFPYVLIGKKLYYAHMYEKGPLEDDKVVDYKGVPHKRRDRVLFVRNLTEELMYSIIETMGSHEAIYEILKKYLMKIVLDEFPVKLYENSKSIGSNYKSENQVQLYVQKYLKEMNAMQKYTVGDRIPFVQVINPKISSNAGLCKRAHHPDYFQEAGCIIDRYYYVENSMFHSTMMMINPLRHKYISSDNEEENYIEEIDEVFPHYEILFDWALNELTLQKNSFANVRKNEWTMENAFPSLSYICRRIPSYFTRISKRSTHIRKYTKENAHVQKQSFKRCMNEMNEIEDEVQETKRSKSNASFASFIDL